MSRTVVLVEPQLIDLSTWKTELCSSTRMEVTPEATTTFFYDDWNLIEERVAYTNGTSSTIRYYWGKDLSGTLQGAGGIGGLLYLTVSNSSSQRQLYVPCYDNNGNITRCFDADGNTVAQYTYDAFGKIVAQSGPLVDFFRHRFSTKYFDEETGRYYYGYRFYSPALMRWLNRDPMEEQGGLNLYVFCGNSPTCSYDPHGFQAHFDVKITPIRVGIILSANNHKSSYPRAATFHSGDLKFSCDKNCRIKVSGELSLWIEMLEQNNSRWDVSFPQYQSSVLVSEDLNAYNHELDHFYTWKEFYTFLKTANSYDGRPYKGCKAKALDLQTRYSRFKAMTQRHSRAFDQTGRNMGGQYSSHPLDTSKFKWE